MTGAASGIGRAVVERLLADGWRVVALDQDDRRLASLRVDHPGPELQVVTGVVEDRESHRRARALARELAPLAAWVGCAGVTQTADLLALTDEHVHRLIDINQVGMLWCAVEAVEEWTSTDSAGALVLISSIHGHLAAPRHTVYEMTKAATEALARSVAVSYGPWGIRAVAVAPGAVSTPALEASLARAADPDAARRVLTSHTPLDRLARAEEVASAVGFLVSSRASYISGTTIAVDGAWSAALAARDDDPTTRRA